jgi:hypothetical protein
MIPIDNCNYLKWEICRIMVQPDSWEPGTNKETYIMKTTIIRAVAPAIIAIAAILLSFRSMNASALVAGYFCVVGVGAVMALDYRVDMKRLFSR